MQNLIVLCHRCLTWGETHSDNCLECGADVCIDLPDIEDERLAEILGKPVIVLGPLRVERKSLPTFGFLVGTTDGVLFLPRLHRRINGAWEGVTSQRLPRWWPFGGDPGSQRFLDWLSRPFGIVDRQDKESVAFPFDEKDSLASRFMDSPGAFFIELQKIKSVTGRRRRIRLDRSPLKTVTFIDETNDGSLLISLNSHIAVVAKEKLRQAR